ncbi:MAG: sporulation protein [Eubacteriales bacterium]|nr:sporulation protein [Eubacteriales bacterium]
MRGFLKYYIFTFITMLILFYPQNAIEYAKAGMVLCSEVLVPSLFPFFVCSGILIYSGFCETLAGLFGKVMVPLFNINGSGAAAFILGIVSGYPLGAQTALKLYEKGSLSKCECERLLAFCNNSGPLFILGSVGVAVYHSTKIGIMLYLSHIAAAVTVGILFRFYKGEKSESIIGGAIREERSLGEIFNMALSGSISSILTVCGAVIFFSVVANLVADLIPDGIMRTVFVAVSELTSGIKGISEMEMATGTKLVLSSAATGFAGLCVHLQVMSVAAGKGVSLIPYITGKVIHALLSAIYTAVLLRFFPVTQTVFARGDSLSGAFFIASLFTVMCTLILGAIATITLIVSHKSRKRAIVNE